ncbi:putative Zn-dependent protease with MMP-like domain [Scopulibacillus daqui]|uniref:Zn-dependent protease with MMP-like domain n=1 Tax=Scopulibacillus daqui TaxID=1469162 RepID=A0ABS2Q1V7_9BACL|nr:hypothetical protein [Scopulibacillus daqui]MBM7646263.1 putative Zn-dependent protease with MMP-like domain [Scopulibacillus daqui]
MEYEKDIVLKIEKYFHKDQDRTLINEAFQSIGLFLAEIKNGVGLTKIGERLIISTSPSGSLQFFKLGNRRISFRKHDKEILVRVSDNGVEKIYDTIKLINPKELKSEKYQKSFSKELIYHYIMDNFKDILD